ncbi:MAG: methyltransferase [Polyangiales bacterium]
MSRDAAGDLLYRLRTRALTLAQRALARPGAIVHRGVALDVARGVHHPAPFLGLGFGALQELALERLPPRAAVLELGTGAGFWALAAARRGFVVTATELPEVPLAPVAQAADRMGVHLRLLHSDLFEDLGDARFDAILFNPPFHDATPRAPVERAWCGGDVVRRCLREAAAHLTADGAMYLIMPRLDRARYVTELAPWTIDVAASQWFPLVGRAELLALRPGRRVGLVTRAPREAGGSC